MNILSYRHNNVNKNVESFQPIGPQKQSLRLFMENAFDNTANMM